MVSINFNSFNYLLLLVEFIIIITVGVHLGLLDGNISNQSLDRALAQSATTGTTNNSNEVSLTLDYAHFVPLDTAQGHQVKLLVNYTVQEDNSSIEGQTINGVMKVYNTFDRTLIRTSASPTGFIANASGTEQFATTLADNSVLNVTAVVQFTNAARTVPISNPIIVELDYE